ncbi:MAG TPA: DUF6580 family putative transport protein [Chitinophagaceae bacterium]|jgi:hypothetical protein
MRITKSVIVTLILLVLVAALYRIFPNRPMGFAPQYAMAIFGGAIFVRNKKWAFLLPVLSMFLSDLFYQILYIKGLSTTPGFYEGQWQNYILFALLTVIGFFIKKINVLNVLIASVISPTVYFILSNFIVWAGGGGLQRPKTWGGLMQSYTDGLPFYVNSIYATLVFSTILFCGYFFVKNLLPERSRQIA